MVVLELVALPKVVLVVVFELVDEYVVTLSVELEVVLEVVLGFVLLEVVLVDLLDVCPCQQMITIMYSHRSYRSSLCRCDT